MDEKEVKLKVAEYMMKGYTVKINKNVLEQLFYIEYPDLVGCVATGKTVVEALDNGEKAKKEWFRKRIEEGKEIPEPGTN